MSNRSCRGRQPHSQYNRKACPERQSEAREFRCHNLRNAQPDAEHSIVDVFYPVEHRLCTFLSPEYDLILILPVKLPPLSISQTVLEAHRRSVREVLEFLVI